MKFSRSQLKKVKKAFNETKDDKTEELDAFVASKSSFSLSEEGYKIKATAKERRKIRKEARAEKSISIEWNLNPGDAVMFNANGNVVMGMIIKQDANGDYNSIRDAKYSTYVLVMTPGGNRWVLPQKLEKIEDDA